MFLTVATSSRPSEDTNLKVKCWLPRLFFGPHFGYTTLCRSFRGNFRKQCDVIAPGHETYDTQSIWHLHRWHMASHVGANNWFKQSRGFYLPRYSIDWSFLSTRDLECLSLQDRARKIREITATLYGQGPSTLCLRANGRTRVPNVTNCGHPVERHTCSLVCCLAFTSLRSSIRHTPIQLSKSVFFIDRRRPSQLSNTLNQNERFVEEPTSRRRYLQYFLYIGFEYI